MDKVKNIVIFVLIAMCCLLYKCNPNTKTEYKERTSVEYDHKRSMSITFLPIPERDTLYLTKYIPKPVIVKDIDDTTKKYYNYTVSFRDSVIDGNIFSNIKTDGTLVHQNFTYKLLKPNYIITNTDSIFVTKTIEKIAQQNKLFIGSSIYYGKNSVSLSFDGLFKTKKNLIIGGGYDPFNKVINGKIYISLGK